MYGVTLWEQLIKCVRHVQCICSRFRKHSDRFYCYIVVVQLNCRIWREKITIYSAQELQRLLFRDDFAAFVMHTKNALFIQHFGECTNDNISRNAMAQVSSVKNKVSVCVCAWETLSYSYRRQRWTHLFLLLRSSCSCCCQLIVFAIRLFSKQARSNSNISKIIPIITTIRSEFIGSDSYFSCIYLILPFKLNAPNARVWEREHERKPIQIWSNKGLQT